MTTKPEPRFRAARIWSNQELQKVVTHLQLSEKSVVNVSAWQDSDKDGETYKSRYFKSAKEYWLTNFSTNKNGFQGDLENEIFLDLEATLPNELNSRFDIVFNHTTLEHIFNVFKAFENLCLLSKDIVIVVVPFLQEQHGEYGDYWRFTPLTLKRLFEQNDLNLGYINFNDGSHDSIYCFAIGAKQFQSTEALLKINSNRIHQIDSIYLGRYFFNSLERRKIFDQPLTSIKNRVREWLQ